MSKYGTTIMSGVIAVLFTAVFLLDVFTPEGLPVSVLFIVPLVLTSLLRRREAPYWLAGASTAATLCGYFFSPSLMVPSWLPAVNRTMVVALLWLTAAVLRRQQDMADHLIHVAALEAENRAHLLKEQTLQRQADKIRDLYNRAPCGYHSVDDMGRYVEVNDTELQWLGYRREDMIGHMRFRDLVVPQNARRFDEIFQRFITQGSIHDLELDLSRKDGSLLPVSLSATAIRDSEGRYIAGRSTIVDITERRRAEAELRKSHETLEAQVRERTVALRESEERQAFLLALSDALRPLTAPADIAGLAAERLGKRFDLNRVFYAELAGSRMTVERDYALDVSSLVGEHNLEAFGPGMPAAYRDGAVIAVNDVRAESRLNEEARAGLQSRQIGAYVDVVLFENKQRVGLLAAQSATPRNWTAAEQSLFREVGERVKSAIEHARAEEALRQAKERFDIVSDAAEVGFWFCDLPFDKLIWDNRVKEHFWLPPDADVTIETFYERLHPHDRELTRRSIEESIANKTRYNIEYHTLSPKGEEKWIRAIGRTSYDEHDKPIRFDGITLDITRRKRDEAERERLVSVAKNSQDFIGMSDVEGIPIFLNRGGRDMVGIDDALDIRATHILEYFVPEEREFVKNVVLPAVMKEGRWVGELTFRHWQTEARIPVFFDLFRVDDPKTGRPLNFVTITRDITERKKAETVLINKNKDLETLLYVTSHDLKEPLRAIESFSQLVLERYADRIDASGGDYLRRIVRATQRLDRLLNDILDLSRAQRMLPPLEEVEAETLVKEALTRLDIRIQETGAAVRIVSPLPRLRVNRTWATQGLYNLLANAMKFTRDGHAPNIEIAPYEVPASATPYAGVVVKDRGPGVPSRQAERIFMLFQRAVGRDVEGTGAGLAIVHQVAERHGGRAWVQPRAGGGSEFVMTFARPTHLPTQEATAVKPWRNAQRVSSEVLAKEAALRRDVAEEQTVRPYNSNGGESST